MRTLKYYLIYEWGIDPTQEKDDVPSEYEDLYNHLQEVKNNEYVFDPEENEFALWIDDKYFPEADGMAIERIYLSKGKRGEILFDIRIIVSDKPTKKITGLTWEDLFDKRSKYYCGETDEQFYDEFYTLFFDDRGWRWKKEHWYDEPDPPEWDD